jgi:hypothetical protein
LNARGNAAKGTAKPEAGVGAKIKSFLNKFFK